MFKVAFLLSATIAFTAVSSLRIDPVALDKLWAKIDLEVVNRHREAENEIQSNLENTHALVDEVAKRLRMEVNEAGESYKKKISELEEEATKQKVDIKDCVSEGDAKIKKLHDAALDQQIERANGLASETVKIIEASAAYADSVTIEQRDLRMRVRECQNIECSNALEIVVAEFYDRVIIGLDQAVLNASNAALIQLPLDLDNVDINRKEYEDSAEKIYEEVAKCADLK